MEIYIPRETLKRKRKGKQQQQKKDLRIYFEERLAYGNNEGPEEKLK